ncbi:MAG: DUF4442 domain-containing protein [Saprospiraceae bacterium]|nr:DUF4442 domain-containing protein [Saprospiraceae bacterium]
MSKDKFLRLVNSPWRFRLFLFWKLPAAWFMGIRLQSCTNEKAVVRLPFGWRSQNPFRSTYFAAQCAAGELSTGILALAILQDMPPVSMLVVSIEAEFYKKADSTLQFTCEEGDALEACIRKAVESGEAQTYRATSAGCLPDGTEAAKVWITWSFKRKKA